MTKSSKLVAARKGMVLLVRRRRARVWMFPCGRRRVVESERKCLRREIREELPKLKLGSVKLWKEVRAKNRRSGRKMSDAIFVDKRSATRARSTKRLGASRAASD
jgi:8-oxo-dGTP diphosphatase